MRLSRCKVMDHINYCKNGSWHSYRFCKALQRLKQLDVDWTRVLSGASHIGTCCKTPPIGPGGTKTGGSKGAS